MLMLDPASHFAAVIAARFGAKKIKEVLEKKQWLPSHVYHTRTVKAVKSGDFAQAIENLRITLTKNPTHNGGRSYQQLLAANIRKKITDWQQIHEQQCIAYRSCLSQIERILIQTKKTFWTGYVAIIAAIINLVASAIYIPWPGVLLLWTLIVSSVVAFIWHLRRQLLLLDRALCDQFEKKDDLVAQMDAINEQISAWQVQYKEIDEFGKNDDY